MLNRIIYSHKDLYFSISKDAFINGITIFFEDGEYITWRFSIKIVYSLKKHIFSKTLEKLIRKLTTTEFIIVSGFDKQKPLWDAVLTHSEVIQKLLDLYENKEYMVGFDRNHIKPRKCYA